MDERTYHPLQNTPRTIDEPTAVAAATTPGAVAKNVWRSRLLDYIQLTKPEITFLVTISALAGFVLGSPGAIDGWTLCWALIGIPLASAGGAVLNHHRERFLDARMRRTASRPPGHRSTSSILPP